MLHRRLLVLVGLPGVAVLLTSLAFAPGPPGSGLVGGSNHVDHPAHVRVPALMWSTKDTPHIGIGGPTRHRP